MDVGARRTPRARRMASENFGFMIWWLAGAVMLLETILRRGDW